MRLARSQERLSLSLLARGMDSCVAVSRPAAESTEPPDGDEGPVRGQRLSYQYSAAQKVYRLDCPVSLSRCKWKDKRTPEGCLV